MSYKFVLVLNREITGDESERLRQSGCGDATITTTAHPFEPDSLVTQLDIDTEAASLAEAIQSALDAVSAIPDLSAPSLNVPPQPNDTAARAEDGPTEAKVAVGARE